MHFSLPTSLLWLGIPQCWDIFWSWKKLEKTDLFFWGPEICQGVATFLYHGIVTTYSNFQHAFRQKKHSLQTSNFLHFCCHNWVSNTSPLDKNLAPALGRTSIRWNMVYLFQCCQAPQALLVLIGELELVAPLLSMCLRWKWDPLCFFSFCGKNSWIFGFKEMVFRETGVSNMEKKEGTWWQLPGFQFVDPPKKLERWDAMD